MKKFFLIFNCSLCIVQYASAQVGQWVWIHGSDTLNGNATYGTQGVSSPLNNPASVYEPCEWKDNAGNFWMFGGDMTTGTCNDLWKYVPSLNEWTWMNGAGVALDPGNYGIRGVTSPLNNPPSRGYAAASWVDTSGMFWMFGGNGVGGNHNDLWNYDPLTNMWTWIKGPNTGGGVGVYGIMGVPDTANIPGARNECASAWTDDNNNLWLFGGSGVGRFNDLWKYDIPTNTWTWMKGSNLTAQPGVYGILGVPDPANTPSGRGAHCRWTDAAGDLWLFGGYEFIFGAQHNDLWRFNIATNNWTWMHGDSISNATLRNAVCAKSNQCSGCAIRSARMFYRQLANKIIFLWRLHAHIKFSQRPLDVRPCSKHVDVDKR
jgi:hypothetical protein